MSDALRDFVDDIKLQFRVFDEAIAKLADAHASVENELSRSAGCFDIETVKSQVPLRIELDVLGEALDKARARREQLADELGASLHFSLTAAMSASRQAIADEHRELAEFVTLLAGELLDKAEEIRKINRDAGRTFYETAIELAPYFKLGIVSNIISANSYVEAIWPICPVNNKAHPVVSTAYETAKKRFES